MSNEDTEKEIDCLLGGMHYWPRGGYWQSVSHRKLMQTIASKKGEGICLDLGCGTGRYRRYLESVGHTWWGADVTECDLQHRDRFSLINENTIPFDDAHFDAVFLFNVIEHFEHPEAMFAEIKRVCKPGGLVAGAVAFHEHEHGSFFHLSHRGLETILKRHGFTVESLFPSEYSGLVFTCQRLFGGGRIVSGQGWSLFLKTAIVTNFCMPFFWSACFLQWMKITIGAHDRLKDAATIYFFAINDQSCTLH